jgi:iron(III) transport system permease protein
MKAGGTTLTLPFFKGRLRPFQLGQWLAVAFFAILTGLPVVFLFIGSFNLAAPGKEVVYGVQNWIRAFTDPGTLSALQMSVNLSVVRIIPAMVIAVFMAWLIARTDMPGGKTIEFICWIAYFVPDFPMVLAWVLLLDPNFGFLNTIARSIPFIEGPVFNPYSFWGIVWVHTAVTGIWFKVMLLTPIFRQLGASLEEAARVAGANNLTTLWRISLPVLSPLILAIAVLSFIRGLQSFNTELLAR